MNLPSDKYNVAWFKLAEYVARGEKERALGLYRLLAHSFDDDAFAVQLEGDILHAFGDKKEAQALYVHAMERYKKSGRFAQGVAVCEHLHSLFPDSLEYILFLIDGYKKSMPDHKLFFYAQRAVALAQGPTQQEVYVLIGSCYEYLSAEQSVTVGKAVLHASARQSFQVKDLLIHLHAVVDGLLTADNQSALQQFLALLQELHDDLYLAAIDYMDSRN